MYKYILIVILSVAGRGYGSYCWSDSDCNRNLVNRYCCSDNSCCLFKDKCYSLSDCSSSSRPFCCSNNQCCSFFDSTNDLKSVGEITVGVIVAIVVVVVLVIIGCCVGIVLCCRRQTNYGRVVRVPATTTTVHQTHRVMQQPHVYQPVQNQHQYPAAPNKDLPPPYNPPAYAPNPAAYPAMPQPPNPTGGAPPMSQPPINPAAGPPYPAAAPPYPMGMAPPVQESKVQASAPPMM